MYRFSSEEKKDAKELVKQLYVKYYLNPIKAAIQQRQEAEEARQKAMPRIENKTVDQVDTIPAVLYTDVKGFILGQPWAEKTTRDLAIMYSQIHPEAPLAKIKQYVQRVTWELKKKNVAA